MGADTDGDGLIYDRDDNAAQTGLDNNMSEGESEND